MLRNLHSAEEAAVYLGINLDELKGLPIPVVMVGTKPQYQMRDLDDWIRSRRLVPLTSPHH